MKKIIRIILIVVFPSLEASVLFGAHEQLNSLENYFGSRLEDKQAVTGLPCEFSYSLLLRQYWPQLDPELKLALGKPFFDSPQLQDSALSPAGYFMLHFDRSGPDAVPKDDIGNNGIPDYIDSTAVILDYVRHREVEELGYQAPLDINGEPATLYHVYFLDLSGEYGTTFSTEEIPGPPGYYRYTAYTVLDNDYAESYYYSKGLSALKITAAHEFHHAIQLSTRVWWENGELADLFLMEMSSSWLEDVLYEEINDYLSDLPYFFRKYSNEPFTSTDFLYPYGNCLFLHMLERQFGVKIGTRLWERIKQEPGLKALATVLREYNTSFLSQLHQYGIWLYYTGRRADPINYFPEGALYPQITIHNEDFLQFTVPFSGVFNLNPLATRLLQLDQTVIGEYSFKIGSTLGQGMVSHLSTESILNSIYFHQSSQLFLQDNSSVNVLLSNGALDTAEVKYMLSASSTLSGGELLAFPNPVVAPQDQTVAFVNLPEAGKIIILNSNGEKISQLSVPYPEEGASWNLKDEHERDVASGVYLYFFKGANKKASGKIAIVR
jgi:hypothetical protein